MKQYTVRNINKTRNSKSDFNLKVTEQRENGYRKNMDLYLTTVKVLNKSINGLRKVCFNMLAKTSNGNDKF